MYSAGTNAVPVAHWFATAASGAVFGYSGNKNVS